MGCLREALPSMAPGLHPRSLFPHKTSAGKLNRSAGSLGRRLEVETAAPERRGFVREQAGFESWLGGLLTLQLSSRGKVRDQVTKHSWP